MNNLDPQYQALLQYIINHGTKKQDRTGTGTISVFGRHIRHKMSEGFPLLTTKKMAFKTMATELIWFLRGDTNIKFLVDNNCHIWDGDAYKKYWHEWKPTLEDCGLDLTPYTKEEFINRIKTDDEFAKKWGELGPIYGKQWRKWNNGYDFTDQIANLIRDLKTNPDSRRLLVSAWNVGELHSMVLPPCHYGFQVYTRELSLDERLRLVNYDKEKFNSIDEWITWYNKEPNEFYYMGINYTKDTALTDLGIPTRAISLMWNQRSVDTFLGLPFNIASYGLLLEIIAKAVNMVPDELIGNLGDTHLYTNHIEQAEEQMSRESYALPKLNINTEFWSTESGECGIGPLDAAAVFNSFKDDNFCKCLLEEDIQLGEYKSHSTIKAPLSN